MINIRIEKATNGAILRGNIGPNGRHQTELFIFDAEWQIDLSNRLDQIEIDAKAQVTKTISDVMDKAIAMEEDENSPE